MLNMGTVLTPFGELMILAGRYTIGKGISIQLMHEEDGPFAVMSVNLPHHQDCLLSQDEFFAKTWSENEPLVEPLLNSGIFIDTGRQVPTGFVSAAIWKIAMTTDIPALP